jgi:hypothetical protein
METALDTPSLKLELMLQALPLLLALKLEDLSLPPPVHLSLTLSVAPYEDVLRPPGLPQLA